MVLIFEVVKVPILKNEQMLQARLSGALLAQLQLPLADVGAGDVAAVIGR
jgi:hypothetical protein